MSPARPLLALEVDGVLALDPPPEVPVEEFEASAFSRWRRPVLIPESAAEKVRSLSARCDILWTSPWSYLAHEALRGPLRLPDEPWPYLPVQFEKPAAIRRVADGRPWAWIDGTDAIDGAAAAVTDGVVRPVNPRRGIADIDPDEVFAALEDLEAAGSKTAGVALDAS